MRQNQSFDKYIFIIIIIKSKDDQDRKHRHKVDSCKIRLNLYLNSLRIVCLFLLVKNYTFYFVVMDITLDDDFTQFSKNIVKFIT